jgi:hypothetical protein
MNIDDANNYVSMDIMFVHERGLKKLGDCFVFILVALVLNFASKMGGLQQWEFVVWKVSSCGCPQLGSQALIESKKRKVGKEDEHKTNVVLATKETIENYYSEVE